MKEDIYEHGQSINMVEVDNNVEINNDENMDEHDNHQEGVNEIDRRSADVERELYLLKWKSTMLTILSLCLINKCLSNSAVSMYICIFFKAVDMIIILFLEILP